MNYIARAKAAQKFLVAHRDPELVLLGMSGLNDHVTVHTKDRLYGLDYSPTRSADATHWHATAVQDGVTLDLVCVEVDAA